ncbi:MAG TPA: hypothetical protein VGL00_16225 [Terracidiphilus sp.]
MPGAALTSLLGGMKGHMPDFGLMLLSEFACNWALLLIGVIMIEFLINRRREQA